MSLLLEALKKAEKAKQEAQRNASAASGANGTAREALSLAPDGAPRRVMTRDELPDISRPLDIHTEDLAPAAPPEPMYAEARAGAPAAGRKAAPTADVRPEPQAKERAAAKKVFEAKYREPNPRLPFYVATALLGIAAFGTIGYFWYQLRPPPPLVSPNPAPKTAEAAVVPPAGSAAVARTEEAAAPVIPGLPPSAASSAPAAGAARDSAPRPAEGRGAKAPAGMPVADSPAAAPAAPSGSLKPVPRATATGRTVPAEPAPADPALTFSRAVPVVHPRVQAGYGAYLSGDLAAARDNYVTALQEEPTNRDALLGLAAIETSAQRFDLAESYYQRLLRADPRDAYAQAGIIGLRGPLIDPVAAESRVKSLLAAEPEAAVLNFTLGNQLAQQARWAEAQQAYFRAYTADPDHPDVVYNLAVSLDHLRQPGLALQYYRRALALSEKRAAGFSALAARNRIADLER